VRECQAAYGSLFVCFVCCFWVFWFFGFCLQHSHLQFEENLTNLVTNFASQNSIRGSKNGNRHFAYFIGDLFNILDRGLVCRLV
jgi:hypothetical protein